MKLFRLDILLAVALSAVIAYLNYLLIRFFLVGEFSQNIASIEISYIQMAKFWVEGGSLWQSQWYLGHPFSVFYTPLLPFGEVVSHAIFGFSFAHAYRVITGIGYILVPVSLFFFIWQISKSKTGAFVGALCYSLLPSVIALLFGEVAADTLSGGLEPRRFAILVRWGEGPHTLALVFIPLFGAFLSRYFEGGKFRDLVCASLFLGLGALTNAIVVWVAFLMIFSMLLSRAVVGAELIDLLKRTLRVVLVSLGLISFWYNFTFITTFFREGGGAVNNWTALFPWGIILLGILAILFLAVIKKILSKFIGLPFALLWFLALFAIVYIYYSSGEERLEYVPQALRLNTEVDLALSTLVGVVISQGILQVSSRLPKLIGNLVWISAVIPVFLILSYSKSLFDRLPVHAKPLSESQVQSVENTNEYRVSKKLAELTGGTDQRVVAPGNYGFWLNYFVDTPQIRGALFQSSTHFWPDHIYYQLTNGADAQISLAWLKIANIGKLVYTTAGSGETYHDFKVPQSKFDSILTKKLEERGDVFFDVPLKNDSIAKIVDRERLLKIKKPFNAIDSEPIFAYVGEIEANSKSRLATSKISESKWRISGEVSNGEAVLFQQTHDPGWKVKKISGEAGGWKVLKDPLDFIVLKPEKTGQFEIEVHYTRPWSVWVGYLLTLGTLGFLATRTYKTYI